MDYKSYENEYNKLIGMINSYDGEVGDIITASEKYHFSKKDLKGHNIKVNQLVSFYPNTIKFCDEKILLAKKIEGFKK